MAIYATQVQCDLSPERGKVHLKYQVVLQGGVAALNTRARAVMPGQQARPCQVPH